MADVRLHQVRKSFGTQAVIHGVDIEIADGEFTVFVGPSGCGKSTLLRLIAGLESVTSGNIAIGGQSVNDLPPADRGIAMVFQSYALYPHMTVAKNIGFGLKLARVQKEEIRQRVDRAAEILQITELLDRKPGALSGGQRQRVAIGRAIVTEPKVFLFDEPLSNLDAALRVRMRIELSKLHRDLRSTIVYVTHDQIEAMTMADKIVVLNDGKVEQVGSPMELYRNPTNLFVAGFIGSPKMNFIDGEIAGLIPGGVTVRTSGKAEVCVAANTGQADVGDRVTLGIRPEHAQLRSEHEQDMSLLRGEVVVVEYLGDETITYLSLEGGGGEIVVRSDGDAIYAQVGEQIDVGMPASSCHLFDEHGLAFPRREEGEL